MRKIILLLISLFIGLQAHTQEQLLQVAKQYLMAGDFQKATPLFKQLLEYNENDVEINIAYIQCLMGSKDYTTAEKYLKKSVKKDKNTPLNLKQ